MNGDLNKVKELKPEKDTFSTVDEYILQFSQEVQEILNDLREVIRKEAPEAEEKIRWQMPTYVLYENLVHFAAHKKHIGFYPGPKAIEVFKEDLDGYKFSKGAIQFPMDKPMPYDLIRGIVKFRVTECQRVKEEKDTKKKVKRMMKND